jgi:predicted MFS family arabinose efflux permease
MHLTGTAATGPAVSRSRNRFTVHLAFLVAGFGVACWAPLVPFVRQRLAIDEGTLGMVLLCFGVGSVAAMVAVGMLSTRYGRKSVMVCSGLGLAMLLPILTVAPTLWSLDAAMNVNAVEVERADDRPLMSRFHALYSIGGFAGAGFMTVLLSIDFDPLHATLLGAALMGVAMLVAWPFVLETPTLRSGPLFVAPRGIVLLIAALACAICLAEGAMRD